jgi:hypothetical protein
MERDHNHMATRSASDVVRDLGTGKRVTGPGSVITIAVPAGASAGAASSAAERAEAARRLQERPASGHGGWRNCAGGGAALRRLPQ